MHEFSCVFPLANAKGILRDSIATAGRWEDVIPTGSISLWVKSLSTLAPTTWTRARVRMLFASFILAFNSNSRAGNVDFLSKDFLARVL